MKIRAIVSGLFVIGLPLTSAAAVAGNGAAVLRLPMSARAAGMADAFVSEDGGVTSLGINPAGAATVRRPELEGMFHSGALDDSLGFFGYAHPTQKGALLLGLEYYSGGPVTLNYPGGATVTRTAEQDFVESAGWAGNLGGGLSVGALVKAYQFDLAQEARAKGFAADAGARWETPLRGLRFGAAIQNVGPAVKFGGTGDPLPLTMRAGASYVAGLPTSQVYGDYYTGASMTVSCDAIQVRGEKLAAVTGGEFLLRISPTASASLRVGWNFSGQPTSGPSFGAGAEEGRYRLDYAQSQQGELGTVQYVSGTVRF